MLLDYTICTPMSGNGAPIFGTIVTTQHQVMVVSGRKMETIAIGSCAVALGTIILNSAGVPVVSGVRLILSLKSAGFARSLISNLLFAVITGFLELVIFSLSLTSSSNSIASMLPNFWGMKPQHNFVLGNTGIN